MAKQQKLQAASKPVVPTPPKAPVKEVAEVAKSTPAKAAPSKKEEKNVFSSLFAPAAPKKVPVAKKEESASEKEDKAAAQARLKAAGSVVAKQRTEQMAAIKPANKPPTPEKKEETGVFANFFGTPEKSEFIDLL